VAFDLDEDVGAAVELHSHVASVPWMTRSAIIPRG
jgi:hypothetical protein